MSVPDLSSCWAKFARAQAHIGALKREIRSWVKTKPYRLAKQTSPDLIRHGYVISVLKQPNLERWSLIASDAIHNLRCALDHLIYAVAVFQTKTNPPLDANLLAFPICDNSESFKKAHRKVRTLSDCIRAEIEGVQPYNRPHPALPPLLGLLRDFDDSDKHRLLHIAMAQAWNAQFKNVDASVLLPGEKVKLFLNTADIVDKSEIAAIIYPRPSPDLKHKLLTHIVISIAHEMSPQRRTRSELGYVLSELLPEVREVIERIVAKA
jgi:hypothetical protein